MVCYSLEPTPAVCPDCADTSRKVLADMVGFEIDPDDVPSNADGDLDEWLDESGVEDPEIRKDIHRLAAIVDDARASLEHAAFEGRKMLAKYPPTERLTMPRESQNSPA
jgi:hypothetical protein